MQWIGRLQDKIRHSLQDDLQHAEASATHARGKSHHLICERCRTVYDDCDDPQCGHESNVSGFCGESCSTAQQEGAQHEIAPSVRLTA